MMDVTAKRSAGFSEKEFKVWLTMLKEAKTIAAKLADATDWRVARKAGTVVDEYKFLLLSELP